jgi:outer membrane protein assembly factor BamD
MKKFLSIAILFIVLVSGCANEFNQVYKSNNYAYKYEYAKQCYAQGKYMRCVTLLQDMVTMLKGTDNAQESLYMLAMAEYKSKDYETAAEYFKKYTTSYPRGDYAEAALFYVGKSLYMSTPEPRLDQTPTIAAITSYQTFLDKYPDSDYRTIAQEHLFELQDKLVQKELKSAQLYYNLGTYFGNCNSNGESNYLSCIITAENALKDYPYSSLREDFAVLLMKSKFELAENSIEEKRLERYQDAEDECYGFINEYPDSKYKSTAEKFIERCKEFTKD